MKSQKILMEPYWLNVAAAIAISIKKTWWMISFIIDFEADGTKHEIKNNTEFIKCINNTRRFD